MAYRRTPRIQARLEAQRAGLIAAATDILAESGLRGSFVPLRLRVLTFGFETVGTWVEEVKALIAGRNEPVTLDWLYRKLAGSPKARRNPNWKAKIRQTLQRGPFEALGGGVWQQEG